MSTIQHEAARGLLPHIVSAIEADRRLTYGDAATLLGRDRRTNSRMVAQVCDLLDAAAAYAGIPLLALVAVREKSGQVNKAAWKNNGVALEIRDAIIHRSKSHKFTAADFAALSEALLCLHGQSNIAAWRSIREALPIETLARRLAGLEPTRSLDAIDDTGVDLPDRVATSGFRYVRDHKIRAAVLLRAAGHCEYCGEAGFLCANGSRYLECHHIISLANDGADRRTNVIALCPRDHREAHFGVGSAELERQMIHKVLAIELRRD